MVRDSSGDVIGIIPLSVTQEMGYRNDHTENFAYSTDINTEQEVEHAIDRYPSYVSRVFRSLILSFSRGIWRSRK